MLGKINAEELNNADPTYLNSEQVAMMMAVDPKFKDKYEIQQDNINSMETNLMNTMYDAYDQKLPNEGATVQQYDVEPPENEIDGSGECAKGGFLQGLLPFLPLISQAVGPIIKGISGLFRRKKTPQQAVKVATGYVENHFRKNLPKYQEMEGDLRRMHHRDIWRRLGEIHNEISRDVLNQIPEVSAQGGSFIGNIANTMNKQFIPKGFREMLPRKATKGEFVRTGALSATMMAQPIIKYALRKMIGNQQQADAVYKEVKGKMAQGSGVYDGGKFSWDKVKRFAKHALKYAVNPIKQITGKLISGDVFNKALTGIMDKFIGLTPFGPVNNYLKEKSGEGFIQPPGGMINAPNYRKGGLEQKKKSFSYHIKLL